MVFPRADRQYILITDAATGTADSPGGLGAILTQIDKEGNHYAISFASRQLKDYEKNYSPFLLEAAAAVWGMEVFNEYLRGKQFILFTDHKPLEKLGHLHTIYTSKMDPGRIISQKGKSTGWLPLLKKFSSIKTS